MRPKSHKSSPKGVKISLEKQSPNFPIWEASTGEPPSRPHMRRQVNNFSFSLHVTISNREIAVLLYVLHVLGFL
jgi:hypothetical protein